MKLFYLLIILCFLSCKKKDGNFTLTGTITDDSFGVGLSDASISLYQVSGSNSNQILISTISTDVNGNYKFVFKREMMEKYILKITKTNYYDFDETIYFSSLSLEKSLYTFDTLCEPFKKIVEAFRKLYTFNPKAVFTSVVFDFNPIISMCMQKYY